MLDQELEHCIAAAIKYAEYTSENYQIAAEENKAAADALSALKTLHEKTLKPTDVPL
jgi:hypothetical protein